MMKKNRSSSIFSKKQLNAVQRKLDQLGDYVAFDAKFFLNMRFISSLVIFLVVLYVFEWGYFLAPVVTLIYYHLLYYLVIEYNINKRSEKLDLEGIQFFEMMTLALESGKNLENAIRIACDNVDNELSHEFKKVLDEVEYGKSFNEALERLKRRIPSDTINNIILNITEANNFGNDIIDEMYAQIDYIRDREIQKTKAIISKIPLKVSIISVIFYVPLIMLLILSPIIIKFIGG